MIPRSTWPACGSPSFNCILSVVTSYQCCLWISLKLITYLQTQCEKQYNIEGCRPRHPVCQSWSCLPLAVCMWVCWFTPFYVSFHIREMKIERVTCSRDVQMLLLSLWFNSSSFFKISAVVITTWQMPLPPFWLSQN